MPPRSSSIRWFAPVLLIALSLGCTLDDDSRYLVMIAAVFLLGAVGEVIFSRTQVPDVVWLILAGVALNASGAVDPANLDPVLPLFSALTLIIVLFEGGRQIVINELITVAPRASAMALLGFLASMFGVAIIVQLAALTGLLPDSWTFTHSLMTGAILGGSSSLIIMPSMALAKVEAKVSNLVGLESSMTDALCVVVAVVLMNVIQSGEASSGQAFISLAVSFGLALGIGLIAGWVWMPVLRTLSGNPYAYPVTLAALLFLYVVVDNLGGNPAMAVLTFSVVVGNAESLMKRIGFSLGDKPLALDDTVVTVHTQATFFIKSFFFTYIGLRLSPPWSLIIVGLLVGVALYLVRIPVAAIVASPSGGFNENQRKMITIALPRGMAAGVLATLPSSPKYAIAGTEQLPALVFAAVVTSIGIFAYGFREVRMRTPTNKLVAPDPSAVMPDGSLPPAEVQATRPTATPPIAADAEPPPMLISADVMPNGMPALPAQPADSKDIPPG
jgi:cell volume regulation protein A